MGLFIGFSLMAQENDLQKLKERADSIKVAYGEEDLKYILALDELASFSASIKDYEAELEYRKQILSILEKPGLNNSIIYGWNMIFYGEIFAEMGKPTSDYIEFLISGIEICEQNGDSDSEAYRSGVIKCLNLYIDSNDLTKAEQYLERYIATIKTSENREDILLEGSFEAAIGQIARLEQNWEKAIAHYTMCTAILKPFISSDKEIRVQYYAISSLTAACLYFFGDLEKSKECLLSCIDEMVKYDDCDNKQYIDNLYFLGNVAYDQNDLNLAINSYLQCEEWIASTYGTLSEEYEQLENDIAGAYLEMGDYVQGLAKYNICKTALEFICKQNNIPLYNDKRYLQVIKNLALCNSFAGDLKSCLSYQKILLSLLENNPDHIVSEVCDAKMDVFNSLVKLHNLKEADSVRTEIQGMINDCTDPQALSSYMYDCFTLSVERNRYQEALELSEIIVNQGKEEDSVDFLSYVPTLIDIASQYIRIGYIPEASCFLDKALDVSNSLTDTYKNYQYWFQGVIFARYALLYSYSDISKATEHIEKSLSVLSLIKSDFAESYLSALTIKGQILSKSLRFGDALAVFKECKQIAHSLGLTEPDLINNISQNTAILNLLSGDIAGAIQYLEEARLSIKEKYGVNNRFYVDNLDSEASYYMSTGNFERSLDLLKESIEISDELFGEGNISSAQSMLSMSTAYLNMGNNNFAKVYAEDGIRILAKNKQDTTLAFLDGLLALGTAQLRLGDMYSANNNFKKAEQFLEDHNLVSTIIGAQSYTSIGASLSSIGDAKSIKLLGRSLALYEQLGQQATPDYFNSLIALAKAYFSANDKGNSMLIPKINNAFKSIYISNIALFSESDRESFLSTYNDLSDVVFSSRDDDAFDGDLYDFVLMNKGLLLGTANTFYKAILNSGDEKLINDLTRMRMLNVSIQRSASSTNETIRQQADSLRQESEKIERELVSKSKDFADYSAWVASTWKDIQTNLTSKNVAIEFIAYNDVMDGTKKYAALILKKGMARPQFVPICDLSQIESFINESPDAIYGDISTSSQFYKTFWLPIEEYLSEGDAIYYSPSDFLHTFALESILNKDGISLDKVYSFNRVSSTKNIIKDGHIPVNSAIVYGGLKYDVSVDEMAILSKEYNGRYSLSYAKPQYLPDSTRLGWSYLPGTKTETDAIADMLKKEGVRCDVRQGNEGNEESFKSLSGSKFDILHIATHGFFIPAAQTKRPEYLQRLDFSGNFDYSDASLPDPNSPMLRSGLLLSGANSAWVGKDLPEEIEDGILTSSEIASCNFMGTELVVLSACETGLGEITSEGVFGLQRAFKMAGAKTIIMSLWKVDDESTRLMMTTMYDKLLSGSSKHEAFEYAKGVVKEKYKSPYYWASFIMLD